MVNRDDIAAMRRQYGEHGLIESELPANPIELFNTWLKEAAANEVVVEANAMVLSTEVDDQPTSRTVLLKDLTDQGFTFFSNYESRKAKQILENNNVSLLFPWYPMERQVIVIGSATKTSKAESDSYFASRPRGSQIGAWASAQSEELSSRDELEKRYAEFENKWPAGSVIPRPDFWGGYVVYPISIEFWQGRYSRLHDRIRYVREKNNNWQIKRLNP
ncbi:MAG: pyridoxamine 5'-phosphate oxidase [Actinobacteria bacterium]|nr:pyridoxamine 5'-phosphate oxidase [Actinomycetota bacterium]